LLNQLEFRTKSNVYFLLKNKRTMESNLFNLLKSAPITPLITDENEIKRKYKHWRIRVMYSLFLGYMFFYLCRKNVSIALPALAEDLHYSNTQLGIIGSLLYLTYGVGKFANGVLADHANPRYFIVIGLLLSALMNVFFGMSSSLWFLAFFWALNGWFQSMGFPPCAKLLANWYSVSERGTMWSIWHVSHQLGGVVISVAAAFIVAQFGWRYSFYIPAAACIAMAVFLFNRLRDTPPSLGLPDIATFRNDIELNADGTEVTEGKESIRDILFKRVLCNKYIWLISLMNLFVYIVRFGTFDWATKFLVEVKGSEITKAGIVVSMIEFAGILGPILAGVITDKFSNGRRGPMCAVSFAFTFVGLAMFYLVPKGHPFLDAISLIIVGFWIYGPQFLVGVFVTDFASRKAASTAIGLTGIFGYAGASLSGVGTGYLVDTYGWIGGFTFWGISALIGMVIAASLWNVCPMTHREKH
jgi:phosphoglycerate transporter family protein